MAPKFSPAYEHVRQMEQRIWRQKELIERLRVAGSDASAAIQRLALMTRALDEMQFQLGALSPTSPASTSPTSAIKNPPRAGKK
jgi:hypothetical protein